MIDFANALHLFEIVLGIGALVLAFNAKVQLERIQNWFAYFARQP
jgi:hypothetical protein